MIASWHARLLLLKVATIRITVVCTASLLTGLFACMQSRKNLPQRQATPPPPAPGRSSTHSQPHTDTHVQTHRIKLCTDISNHFNNQLSNLDGPIILIWVSVDILQNKCVFSTRNAHSWWRASLVTDWKSECSTTLILPTHWTSSNRRSATEAQWRRLTIWRQFPRRTPQSAATASSESSLSKRTLDTQSKDAQFCC